MQINDESQLGIPNYNLKGVDMTITVKVKRPKFYDFFTMTPTTTRVCSVEGCNEQAPNIDGYYLVEGRRVRVWVCDTHRVGNPNRQLPVPASIQYALDEEAAYRETMENFYRLEDRLDGGSQSIKTLAPSGHGEPIAGDRVAAWRWGA